MRTGEDEGYGVAETEATNDSREKVVKAASAKLHILHEAENVKGRITNCL